MISLSRTKHDAAVIRRVFKGEPDAYRYIIEKYQPMVYAVALAHTGNIFQADMVVVAAFKEGFDRLVSLTDPRHLGMLFCALARSEAENLAARRSAGKKTLRKRAEASPIDMEWAQSELIDPLNEELGSFSAQERAGLLLNAFFGLSARNIAYALKLERKEAEEDLARTRENVERALLKDVVNALDPEVNSKERLIAIMNEVAGPFIAQKAAEETRLGKPKRKVVPHIVAVAAVIVLAIGAYFGYRAFQDFSAETTLPSRTGTEQRPGGETDGPADPGTLAGDDTVSPDVPAIYTIEGRVVDSRFTQDGVAGLTVAAAGREAQTDFFGAFELRGLQRGEHRVTVSYDGVVLAENRRLTTERRNSPIQIDVNENVPARFHFRGRVFDHTTGAAIQEFEVATCKDFPDMLQPYVLELFKPQRHTEGLLHDRFVTLGEYTMYVRAQGYAPTPRQFIIDENWDFNRVHEFPLQRAAALEATVYSPTELSIAGASVMPRQGTAYGTAAGVIEYLKTDSMGRFTIYFLPVGVQSFLIYHLDYGTGRAIVELEPGKTEQIKIQLPRPGALTGDITLDRKPITFASFRRRAAGATVDQTRNLVYNSPGQYEIVFAPEPATIIAAIEPTANEQWFERRMELETIVTPDEPTWLDFNFKTGQGRIEGDVLLRGEVPRSVFIELVYNLDDEENIERIVYELGSVSSFRIDSLPLGNGEFNLYASPRAMSKTDFASARSLMDRFRRPIEMTETVTELQMNVAL